EPVWRARALEARCGPDRRILPGHDGRGCTRERAGRRTLGGRGGSAAALADRARARCSRTRDVGWCRSVRQRNAFEEVGGKLGAAGKTGLLIDRSGVLTDRCVTAIGVSGDRLVAVSLEQQERDLALGGCQLPGPELCVDCTAESRQRLLSACLPDVPLCLSLLQRGAQAFHVMRSCAPAQPKGDRECEATRYEHQLEDDMKRQPAGRLV